MPRVGCWLQFEPRSHSKVQASMFSIRKRALARPNVSLFTLASLLHSNQSAQFSKMNKRPKEMGWCRTEDMRQRAQAMFKDFVCAANEATEKKTSLLRKHLIRPPFECAPSLSSLTSEIYSCLLLLLLFNVPHSQLVTIFKSQALASACVSYCAIAASHYVLLHLSIAAMAKKKQQCSLFICVCPLGKSAHRSVQMRCCRLGTDERCLRHQEVRKWHINEENK